MAAARLRTFDLALSAMALAFAVGAPSALGQSPDYPATKKGLVVDGYHGVSVADPYRWLENLNSAEVKHWIDAQNAVTDRYLAAVPWREILKRRLTQLWDYPKVSPPVREGGRLFYRKNRGLERQSVLYTRTAPKGPARVLLDPNLLSSDGSISLSQVSPSPDGRHIAYSLAEGGADWQDVHVRDLATGRDLSDTVKWVRFSGISWTEDGRGFFYSRFPEPPKGQKLSAVLSGQQIYYHRTGSPQSQDRLIHERKDLPTWFLGGEVTEDGRYLLIRLRNGTDPRNRLYYADLGDPRHPDVGAPIQVIVDQDSAAFDPLGNIGNRLYLRTDLDAPRGRVIYIDLRAPTARGQWVTVVPESEYAIQDARLAGGRLLVHYLADVQSRLRRVSLAGTAQGELPLPEIGTVAGLTTRADSPEVFYSFTSPLYPTTVFRGDVETGRSEPFEAAAAPFDPSDYETKRVFYSSGDGTRVPMFITARKGLPLDGGHPTLLSAYGGFGVNLAPTYRPEIPAWLELGGVYATANLRGGGEYGEDWHRAGMKAKKQNVFDDFIAAAEYLVRERYTSPAKLAILGGSNGGLLVGAVMTQRPDLFAAAIPVAGVLDMLRFDQFTGGHAWASEYGSAGDPAAFAYLKAYSPLHNITPGACYPATLVATADFDDRVVPSHSYKFVAALQAAQNCDRPALLRVDTRTSHGYRPTDKRIAELADLWTFAAASLGMRPAPHEAGQ